MESGRNIVGYPEDGDRNFYKNMVNFYTSMLCQI